MSPVALLGEIAASRRRAGGGGGGGGTGANYIATVLTDTPVLFMPLDEASGSFIDRSTNAATGTANGTITRSQTMGRTGLGNGISQLPGAGANYVNIPDSVPLRISGDVTFEAWIILNASGMGTHRLIATKDYAGANNGYGFWISNTNVVRVTNMGSGVTVGAGSTALSSGVLYHVAWTRSSSTFSVYVNGVLDTSASVGTTVSATTSTYVIGNTSVGGGLGFYGTIYGHALYSTALTAARIRAHYLAGQSAYSAVALALSTAPSSYWGLCEGAGATFFDAIGGKDLTLHGSVGAYNVDTALAGVGNGINFNGTGYPWRAGSPALTNPGSSGFSFCGFIYLGNSGGLTQPWFAASQVGGHNDPYYTFYLSTSGGSNYRWAVATTSFNPIDTSQAILSTATWHHLAFTFDSTKVAKIYHDGSLVYTSSAVGGSMPPTGMSSFAFGTIPALDSTTYTPVARYSNWGYWANYVLTATDITNLYAARL